jgi:hypothetical protein
MRDTKKQDFFLKFDHSQRMPTSPLWNSQRVGSLSILIHPNDHQDLVQFPLSNHHKGEGNINFLRSTTTLVTLGQPSPFRGTNPQE